jgi:hypothetical protein
MAFTRGNLWASRTKALQQGWLGRTVTYIQKGPDLINNESLSAIDYAGTSEIPLIKGDVSDQACLSNTTATVLPNNVPLRAYNAAGTASIDLLKLDADDVVRVGGSAGKALRQTVSFHLSPTAKMLDQVFFIAPYAMKVEKIQLFYDVVNTGAMTVQVKKMADGVTLAAGTALHTALDVTATARTVYTATLSSTAGVLDLAYKDRLGMDFSATLNGLAGVTVTITFTHGGKGDFAVFYKLPAAEITDQHFHLALYPQTIKSILYSHMTLGSDVGAVTCLVKKCTGTSAAASGTTVQGAGASFNCKSTIDTVQVGTLAATRDLYRLAPGDRLAIDVTGTTTALTGVVIVVTFDPDQSPTDRVTVRYIEELNADMVDASFFIADQNYEILEAAEVHSTAFAGAVNLHLTRDAVLTAAGAGTKLNTVTIDGFQGDGTVETVQFVAFAGWVPGQRFLLKGDRLGVDYTAATTGIGALIAVALKPV